MNSSAKKLGAIQPTTDADRLVLEVSKHVSALTGIQLGERQASMVLNRIKRRILELRLNDEKTYLDYFLKNRELESAALVSLLTTHHTYFFREFSHFEFLAKTALPKLIEKKRQTGDKTIRIWSAACSTGQEVYSLAMFLDYYITQNAKDFSYEVRGTDVDPASVKMAVNGVYKLNEIQEVPMQFLNNHWAKGTGDIADFVKVKKTLRERVKFDSLNLISFKADSSQRFDIVFCRNVFIYFSHEQIKLITSQLIETLTPTGFLFLGISESLNGLSLPVASVGPSVYRHKAAIEAEKPALAVKPTETVAAPSTPTEPAQAAPLRVLCVDDSPSILALLKKLLTKDAGFEVVGTAGNGLEAVEALKKLKVDLMTLDIHMPQQTGLEYLKASFNKDHPPVVMISSVSRDDSSLALKCLEAGATDYIEKPALTTMLERADEIRMKLKFAALSKNEPKDIELSRALSRSEAKITDVDKKLRVVLGGLSDREKIARTMSEFEGTQPATVLVLEGAGGAITALKTFLQAHIKTTTPMHVSLFEDRQTLKPGELYLIDIQDFSRWGATTSAQIASIFIYGRPSRKLLSVVNTWPLRNVLLEDLRSVKDAFAESVANDIVPATSFAYMSVEYLGRGAK